MVKDKIIFEKVEPIYKEKPLIIYINLPDNKANATIVIVNIIFFIEI